MPDPIDNRVTVGAVLDSLRKHAVGRLRSARPGTDLLIVAMTGSGRIARRRVDTKLEYWRRTESSGPFALCYAVDYHTDGSPVSKIQADGGAWGFMNSYRRAVKDVARKSNDLRNNRDILRRGSVFTTPAYVVAYADLEPVKKLLKIAYEGWLRGTDPLASPELVERFMRATPTAGASQEVLQVVKPSSDSAGIGTIGDAVVVETVPEIVFSDQVTVFERAATGTLQQKEAALLTRFRRYLLKAHGGEFVRCRIRLPYGSLVTDTMDVSTGTLYEAKSNADRETVRTALGQVLDYGRYTRDALLAVLLPDRPPADVVDLLEQHNIGCVVEIEPDIFADLTMLGRCP